MNESQYQRAWEDAQDRERKTLMTRQTTDINDAHHPGGAAGNAAMREIQKRDPAVTSRPEPIDMQSRIYNMTDQLGMLRSMSEELRYKLGGTRENDTPLGPQQPGRLGSMEAVIQDLEQNLRQSLDLVLDMNGRNAE